ncbi:HAD family hydrolase [Falsibacillus albus]|uniref:HAD family hydrolase n=1 Tax=Falsibacillus albus TaxID=2478915 RepID=A0A3L7JU74_9BACI|nr:HAD family hydrolase [Falsibacillus albus]RLQ93181.1 HAD family hydrolase [Falsibacillus albus]
MFKAILFDLDGTLHDRHATIKSFISDQHRRLLIHTELDEKTYLDTFIRLENNGYVWKDQVYKQLTEEFSLSAPWEQLLNDYVERSPSHAQSFEGILPMLKQLKQHYKLGLITNGKSKVQKGCLEILGLTEFFHCTVISEEVNVKKPEPEIFYHALNLLNIEPHQAIYVGDHPANDIQAAHEIGMKTIWIDNGIYDRPSKADWITDEVRCIPEILETAGVFPFIENLRRSYYPHPATMFLLIKADLKKAF